MVPTGIQTTGGRAGAITLEDDEQRGTTGTGAAQGGARSDGG